MAVEIFVNRVDPYSCNIAQWRVDICRYIIRVKAVEAGLPCINNIIAQRRLLHAVDNAAAAAATKDKGIRPFENFDPFDVVQTAIILDIVTHAIEEEVSGGVLPTQRNLVAIAFTLAHCCPRNIAQDVRKRMMCLIIQLIAGHDVDGLGNIHQRRVGFCSCNRIGRKIAITQARYDDRPAVIIGFDIKRIFGPGRLRKRRS